MDASGVSDKLLSVGESYKLYALSRRGWFFMLFGAIGMWFISTTAAVTMPEPAPDVPGVPETVVYPGPRDTVAYSISGGYFTRVFGYPSGSGDPGATIRSA
ncbi:MAG: hypothetical protein LBR84_00670, partial [Tannerella sp.]|nr:hypothetical protein [Tannerella sp.]